MAYRRRQVAPRPFILKEEFGSPDLRPPPLPDDSSSSSSASSLAAKAIRASSAYRDSSLSSAYGHSALSLSRDPNLGRNIVENWTADIIQETRKLQIRKKGSSSEQQNQTSNVGTTLKQPLMQTYMQPQMQTDLDTQLKASRNVAMATAAKAKLLLRELKRVKADLAFTKERCAQLEEENGILRESLQNGDNPEDDDLIRLQLETLLAEKAQLAQENSVFARENRFLRQIVEYHQLTNLDVIYLDEGSEEVAEVFPINISPVSNMHFTTSAPSSSPIPEVPRARSLQELAEISPSVSPLSSFVDIPKEEDLGRLSDPA